MENADWAEVWQVRAQVYAFLGNSLLGVMSEEDPAGLDPLFWCEFPLLPANAQMERSLAALEENARLLASLPGREAVHWVAAEYTRLFVGPGVPPAPLWESLYREGGKFLFGQPTFDMKQVLREHGLGLDEGARQLEDHLGVELLYLAAMSERFAAEGPGVADVRAQADFIREHPLWWVGELHKKVEAVVPDGYYAPLIELVWGVLLWDVELLGECALTLQQPGALSA